MRRVPVLGSWAAVAAVLLTTTGVAATNAAAPVRLQALTATSGEGVEKLLDGNLETTWRPLGEAIDEGILFRFETEIEIGGLTVTPCGANIVFDLFLNGTKVSFDQAAMVNQTRRLEFADSRSIRSAFLKLRLPSACLAEVGFLEPAGKALAVVAPRTVRGSVTASSTLAPADAYHVSYLFDKRDDFGWVEGVKGLGEGERVTVTFDAPTEIVALEVWNGYQRSRDHFEKNARVRTLSVSADNAAPVILNIEDTMGPYRLTLPQAVKAKELSLTITEAKKGSKYPDLVISELRFWDKAGPFSLATPDDERRTKALLAALSGKALGDFVDRQWVGFCDSGPAQKASFKLRSNHSFVYYSASEKDWGNETAEQVFDGAWVVDRNGADSGQVKLYGRKHLISTTWTPYEGQARRDTTRVAGGAVTLTPVAAIGLAELGKRASAWGSGRGGPACQRLTSLGEGGFKELVERDGFLLEGKTILGVFWSTL